MSLPYRERWVIDFEFTVSPGNRQVPICLVSKNLDTGEVIRRWLEGKDLQEPPYNIDDSVILIAYYSSAEWGCHLALGWKQPAKIIDLFAEFRVLTNGLFGVSNSLLGACKFFKIETITSTEKDSMRDRVLAGAPYSDEEKQEILNYCQSDVEETCKLYRAMEEIIDIDRAYYRGAYMWTVAEMEYAGIPIDTDLLDRLSANWELIKLRLIELTDKEFGFYEGVTFKVNKFEEYLIKNNISWKRTVTGKPVLKDEYFKNMVKIHMQLAPIKDLRYILGQLKLKELPIGTDGRNRCMLSPFRSKTGRNQPSSSKYIFGPAVWLRGLIKPEKGKVLSYIDFSQQEFFIAAVLSGDKAMQESYLSGDPYLEFAKLAGAIPPEGTKKSHKAIRDLYKTCALGLQYSMGSKSLAEAINKSEDHAKELISHHKRLFKKYWAWQEKTYNQAIFSKQIHTCYGWQLHVMITEPTQERSLKNFLMQATGSEILRVSCYLLSQAGIKICGPVHDAILIECDEVDADTTIEKAQRLMEQASLYVLGQAVRTEAETIRYPDRYSDPRGELTWNKIMEILQDIENKQEPTSGWCMNLHQSGV